MLPVWSGIKNLATKDFSLSIIDAAVIATMPIKDLINVEN